MKWYNPERQVYHLISCLQKQGLFHDIQYYILFPIACLDLVIGRTNKDYPTIRISSDLIVVREALNQWPT